MRTSTPMEIPARKPTPGLPWKSFTLTAAAFLIGWIIAPANWSQLTATEAEAAFGVACLLPFGYWLARRRELSRRRKSTERFQLKMQSRLERCCQRIPRPHARRSFAAARHDRQYMTVAHGHRSYRV